MSSYFRHKRSYLKIQLPQLVKNYRAYLSSCKSNTKIMAVVKANAYGHGAVEVACCLQNAGVELFAVSNIDEAIELRNAGIQGEILILGYTPIEAMGELKKYDITQTLLSKEYAKLFYENAPKGVKCQFAINTGMNRLGLRTENMNSAEETVRYYASRLNLNGIFTHLTVADSASPNDIAFTCSQISAFEELASRLSDLNLPYIHCMNSAGGINACSKHADIVRLGIMLYGLLPNQEMKEPSEFAPILSWKSVVSMVEAIEEGESVGYGRTFIAPRKMQIATIPTGYADGYPRSLSNRGYVLIHGRRAPIVGNICMDQMMVDVTDIPEVVMNDEVVLIGKDGDEEITVAHLASLTGTIGYEIVCGISSRVERIYL